MADALGAHAGENGRGEAADEEHQSHDDDGVVLQEGDEAGAEDQNHAYTQNGHKPEQCLGFPGIVTVIGVMAGDDLGVDCLGVTQNESHQQSINQDKCNSTEPDAGIHRQTRKILGDANCERITQTGGEATANGQQAHAQTGHHIPAQTHSQLGDDGNQRDALFEGTDGRAHGHEEEGDDCKELVSILAEFGNDGAQHVVHQAAILQTGEDAADDHQECQNGDDHAAAVSSQCQDGGEGPFPEGKAAFHIAEGSVGIDDGIACGVDHTGVSSAGNEEGQQVCQNHQCEDHKDCGQVGFDAYIQTAVFRFLIHICSPMAHIYAREGV